MNTKKAPKNWSDWDNPKNHFSDYSRDSKFSKVISYGIASMLILPAFLLFYMMSI